MATTSDTEKAARKKAYMLQWRAQNRDKVRATAKAWAGRNPEKVKAHTAASCARNGDKRKAYQQAHYIKHREKKLAYQRQYAIDNATKVKVARIKYVEKNASQFKEYHQQYQKANRAQIRTNAVAYNKQHAAKLKDWRCEWYAKNKEQQLAYRREYYEANKSRLLAEGVVRTARRRKEDALFAITCKIRSNVAGAIARCVKKSKRTEALLGCTIAHAREHVSRQFTVGMDWSNHGRGHGKWNIDHIVPMSTAKTQESAERLCHYTNLQPLWFAENMAKGAKLNWTPPRKKKREV
jgi:hypothetical protein